MRNSYRLTTLSLLGISLLTVTSKSYGSVGSEGASFLDIPVGAGPAALGSAYTPLATNAYAPVWNPAGLGMLSGNELAGQHLSYLESIHYEFLSFVHPLDKGREYDSHRGIGFSVQYLGSGDINRTEVDSNGNVLNNGDPTGTFSSYFASYNLSYGQTLNDKLAVGVTGKMIRAKIDDVTAGAYAADLAGLYKMNEKVQMGASLVNMGSKLKFISDGDDLPMAFKLGGAFKPTSHYLVTAEGVYGKNGQGSFHTGAQWRPLEVVSLRVGYKTDTLKGLSPLAGFTTGLGLHLWGQEFDYAWAPYGDLGDAQYFSLLVRFGGEENEKRNLIRYQDIKKHRTVKHGRHDELEPEYQQLMQLLSADDSHLARIKSSRSNSDQ